MYYYVLICTKNKNRFILILIILPQSSSSPSVARFPIFSLNSSQSIMKCLKLWMLVKRYST